MDWALFCQIEVILLTVGLVGSFLIYSRQNAKDNSFFKRVVAVGKALQEYGKGLADKSTDFAEKMRKEKHDE